MAIVSTLTSATPNVGDTVSAKVGDSLGDSRGANVGNSVGAEIGRSGGTQVGDSIEEELGNSVSDSVDVNVGDSAVAYASAGVATRVTEVRRYVGAAVGCTLGATFGDPSVAEVATPPGGADIGDAVDAEAGDSMG